MEEDEIKSPWAWVLLGCAMGVIFSIICFFCVIKQNDNLQKELKEVKEKVEKHDEIMATYEFFNKTWERLYNEENKEK